MTTRPIKVLLATAGCAGLLLAAGCETTPMEPAPNFIGDTVIVSDYAKFFRLGPQQAGGADLSLRTGERVMLQRKEFGYSRVQLEDGQVGYMANEDLQEAPPETRRKRGLRDASSPGTQGQRRTGGGSTSASTEEDFYDEINLPDPNLDILPEDLPLEPLPELDPLPRNETPREPVQVPVPENSPSSPSEVSPIPLSSPLPEATPPPVSTST